MNTDASSGLARFIRLGALDAEARILPRLPPPVADDPKVVAIVESSGVVRALSRALQRSTAAADSSSGAALIRSLASSWLSAHWAVQRRGVGLLLLVAVVVHVVLVWTQSEPAGWLWLIVPGVAAIIGLVLLMTGVANPSDR